MLRSLALGFLLLVGLGGLQVAQAGGAASVN